MISNKSWLLLPVLLISVRSTAIGIDTPISSNQDTTAFVSPFQEDNERCFKCHGQSIYEYTNENLGRQVKALMFSERIIERKNFYGSNHKSFSCTDCHSEEYTSFPHSGQLRMEQQYNCIDCHGGDEKFAKFNFEAIEADYQASVHFKLEEGGFTCWKCHNPHEYKISARNSNNLKETILFDNNICLNCHANFSHFQLLTNRDEINILAKHDWLPNQSSHFKSVRCIECHAEVNNNVLISHLINPKEKAVRKCNECHSQNSLLMSSLYKFESKEQRKDGFFNGIIMNESYVIGANRNEYLNVFSLIIFGLVILIICGHLFFRLRKKQNK
ncbi:MAG: cytochrome c3 family protein [Bacteroidia bacterium]|nr:cytochrome c3 family protein [Bacteroidia bacterium]